MSSLQSFVHFVWQASSTLAAAAALQTRQMQGHKGFLSLLLAAGIKYIYLKYYKNLVLFWLWKEQTKK